MACTLVSGFSQGLQLIWAPTTGTGARFWDDPGNWLPGEPPSVPGDQDSALVQGVSGTGRLLQDCDLRSPALVKELTALAGGSFQIDRPLTVVESSMFEGVANYVNQSRAKASSLYGTNSLILLGEENLFGRWTYIACNVENHGYAVVENIGEVRGSRERTWWNRLGSRLDLNLSSTPELGAGTPASGLASSYGTFPKLRNDMGAEVIVEIAPHLIESMPETMLVEHNEGLFRVDSGFVQILAGEKFGGRLEVGAEASVRLGRSFDIPGGEQNTLTFPAGTILTGDGNIGFAANGRYWNLEGRVVFDVAITNQSAPLSKGIFGGAATFLKRTEFEDSMTLGPQFGEGLTDFWGATRFDSTLTIQRNIDNFGTMTFSRSGSVEASLTPLIQIRNQPGGRMIMEHTLEGGVSGREWREEDTMATLMNLPGGTFRFLATNGTTSLRPFDWAFINDGFFRLDGGGIRFRDGFEQGALGVMQLGVRALVTLHKTTNMAGRVIGNGLLTATNLVFQGEFAPQRNVEAYLSPGELALNGSFQMTAGARTMIELAGRPDAQESWDRLVVTGRVTLGGTLTVICTNGLAAAHGDHWRVVEVAGEKSGAFDAVNFVNLPAGFTGVVEADSSGVTVELRQVGEPVNYSGWNSGTGFPNPNDSEPGSDPDGDGMANALEYAFGTDPLGANGNPIEISSEAVGETRELVLRFERPSGPSRPADVEWIYEVSADLVTWQRVNPTVVIGPIDAEQRETVEVRFTASPGLGFARVKLQLGEE